MHMHEGRSVAAVAEALLQWRCLVSQACLLSGVGRSSMREQMAWTLLEARRPEDAATAVGVEFWTHKHHLLAPLAPASQPASNARNGFNTVIFKWRMLVLQ